MKEKTPGSGNDGEFKFNSSSLGKSGKPTRPSKPGRPSKSFKSGQMPKMVRPVKGGKPERLSGETGIRPETGAPKSAGFKTTSLRNRQPNGYTSIRADASFANKKKQPEQKVIRRRRAIVTCLSVVVLGLVVWGIIAAGNFAIVWLHKKSEEHNAQTVKVDQDETRVLPKPVDCAIGDLQVEMSQKGGWADSEQIFHVKIKNNSQLACLIDGGRTLIYAEVNSGEWRVASTKDFLEEDTLPMLLGPLDEAEFDLKWDGKVVDAQCKKPKTATKAGVYSAKLLLKGKSILQNPLTFQLKTKPAPVPSASVPAVKPNPHPSASGVPKQ